MAQWHNYTWSHSITFLLFVTKRLLRTTLAHFARKCVLHWLFLSLSYPHRAKDEIHSFSTTQMSNSVENFSYLSVILVTAIVVNFYDICKILAKNTIFRDELIRQTCDREGLFCPHYISFIHIKVMVYVIRIRRTRRLTFFVIRVVGHISISFVSHEIFLFNRRVRRAFTSCMELWYLKRKATWLLFYNRNI